MNPKERYYSGVARETIHRITANRENWTSFLATMARNYDFTYPEQVMIYAQRPNATLCKPYEEWNTDQYRRYVKRGSTGIALFVMNQDKPYLRYVFDVADTGVRRSSPSITPWRVTDENRRFIMDEMERVFQVPSEGILEYQLENIAINLAREYWDDFKKPILDIVADRLSPGHAPRGLVQTTGTAGGYDLSNPVVLTEIELWFRISLSNSDF